MKLPFHLKIWSLNTYDTTGFFQGIYIIINDCGISDAVFLLLKHDSEQMQKLTVMWVMIKKMAMIHSVLNLNLLLFVESILYSTGSNEWVSKGVILDTGPVFQLQSLAVS